MEEIARLDHVYQYNELVAPLRRKAIHSKLLISKRNRDFFFSRETQKTAIYYRFWCSKRWSKIGGANISTE